VQPIARRVGTVAVAVVRTARDAQFTFLAAAIAYYAFVSLVPLLALAIVLSTAIGGEALVERLLDRTDAVLTSRTQELLREALVGGRGRAGATAFGAIAVSWSAAKVFRALDTAFSQVYGTASGRSIFQELRDALVVVVAIVVGVAVMSAVSVVADVLPLGPFGPTVATLLALVTLTVVLLPMYSVFPDDHVGVREALPGAVTAAVGWTLLGATFSIYVAFASTVAVYGVLGGIFLLVTFLYVGAMILVLGAVVNVTLGRDRQLQLDSDPQPGVPLTMAGPHDDASPDEPAGGDAAAGDDGASPADRRSEGREDGDEPVEFDPGNRTPEEARLREEVADLRAELDEFRDDVEDRTVERDAVEGDLRRYVRRRVRRGHARGWGPYLVLLYGTGMTVGAFYYLSGGWAILAMLVVWLSTLGLYTLMVLVGFGISILGIPGRLRDRIGNWRD
jgi:membrane protein